MARPAAAREPAERRDDATPCDTTWAALTSLAPSLLSLERDVRRAASRIRSGNRVNLFELWDGRDGYKRRLSSLVGWWAINPRLRTSTAYEVAYRHLFDILEIADEAANGVGS